MHCRLKIYAKILRFKQISSLLIYHAIYDVTEVGKDIELFMQTINRLIIKYLNNTQIQQIL